MKLVQPQLKPLIYGIDILAIEFHPRTKYILCKPLLGYVHATTIVARKKVALLSRDNFYNGSLWCRSATCDMLRLRRDSRKKSIQDGLFYDCRVAACRMSRCDTIDSHYKNCRATIVRQNVARQLSSSGPSLNVNLVNIRRKSAQSIA